MSFPEDEELEEIRRRKLLEYQRKLEEAKKQEALREAEEARKQELLRKILTPEARLRLANLRLVKPELVDALEAQLIQLAASGSIRMPVDDETLRQILERLATKRDIKLRVSFT
ncbi:MAG: DNA-binding protein [Thermofilum sp.]|uniref:DNA-binding protein ENU21_03165 n=1 Tax=Thermofilum pendens TaxID=2269 RepID=A0A7C4D224_THEPE